ncbi:glycosyltransferase family 2 protein [Candidatus Woesebacteria bacterium]|nr:glycosyltransferase family 2 protein [Candidatus Woesebacteria bacterium]MCD8506856.1 glycosyltransferase family 2 protein [Candidatus Woesebacteria bacterium]MCD8527524.1 glycosyltransferase family 2 protein [Candidatus Woesebacteria bacterium]MCD8546264.1 glycosyltransferase family 2 protein [Candidatus Woesebacteria bacterium]
MSVAIIIPTLLSDFDMLQACLESLAALKKPPEFSVYVMANTSQDTLTQFENTLPQKLSEKLDIKFFSLGQNTGFTGAANAGITASTEDLVILLNDDTTVDPNWLTELVATHSTTGADMIASTIYLGNKTTLDSQGFTFRWRGQALTLPFTDTASDNWKNHPDLLSRTNAREPFGPDAAAALYTRQLLQDLRGFRPSFFAYLEDVDLSLRARRVGFTCALAENAIVFHHKHATSSGFSGFKARQDFRNWWRIVLGSYPLKAWTRFAPRILLERAKNLSGMIKAWK